MKLTYKLPYAPTRYDLMCCNSMYILGDSVVVFRTEEI